jgi:hypothetical protein
MMEKFKDYLPVGVIVLISLLMALVTHGHDAHHLMAGFMGYFFVIFAMFKFFDLKGFTHGFAMYDILTQKDVRYAYAYPFMELGLGLGYLSGTSPFLVNFLTLLLMSISAYGVIKAMMEGLDVRCACLGTTLNVPLSTVSVLENVGMGLMALLNLYWILF